MEYLPSASREARSESEPTTLAVAAAMQFWTVIRVLVPLLALLNRAHAASPDLSPYVASDGVIYADQTIMDLAFGGPRDYTVALLLTAEGSRFDCAFCRVLGPDFRLLASSYAAEPPATDKPLYFIVADVDRTQKTFQTLGLTHAPNLVFYPPTQTKSDAKLGVTGRHQFTSFLSSGNQVDYLVNVFQTHGYSITVRKPFPWDKAIKTVATGVGLLVAGIVFRRQLLKIWQAKQIWLAMSLMCVIMFISGHMYNVTRGTPFMGQDGDGIVLVERSFNSQLAAETQILATLYALLSFTTIGLIKLVPKLETRAMQTAGALFGTVVILLVYSALIETFKLKNGGYPIWILPVRLF